MTDELTEGETGEQKRQRVAENLRRLKAAGRPREEWDEYLASERESPTIERDGNDMQGAALQTVTDAATFGLAGMGEDALTSLGKPAGTFTQTRDLRREGKRELAKVPTMQLPVGPNMVPISPSFMAETAGALLNPLQRLIKPAKAGASLASRLFRSSPVNAAAEAGTQSVGENVGTSDDAGTLLANAGKRAGLAAGTSLALKAPAGVVKVTKRLGAPGGRNLAEGVLDLDDEMGKLDTQRYGIAEGEAASTPAITAVLNSRTVKPYAEMIRASETFEGADDATVLMEAYKLMSRAQRKAGKATEGSPDFLADVELKLSDIGKAKERIIKATQEIDPATGRAGIPSLASAIEGHRVLAGRIDAYEEATDIADKIINAKATKGGKIRTESPEAWLKRVDKMTPDEAQDAYRAMIAQLKGVPKLTGNMLGGFGVASSAMKSPLGYSRLRPYLTALEAKMGGMADSPLARRLTEGAERLTPALSRVIGSRPE